jgi:hypothetical protein
MWRQCEQSCAYNPQIKRGPIDSAHKKDYIFGGKKLSNANKYVGIESAQCGSELLSFVLFMVGKKDQRKFVFG